MTTFLTLNALGGLLAAVAWFTRWCHRRGPNRHTSRGIRRLEHYANNPANRAEYPNQPRKEDQL